MATKAPTILKDPRFRAGYKLITSGRAGEGAIDVFATLLEDARSKYGETSIETAPVYYEYGNALFRNAQRQQLDQPEGKAVQEEGNEEHTTVVEPEEEDQKPAAVEEKGDNSNGDEGTKDNQRGEEEEEEDTEEIEDDKEEDDVQLALEMMETSFSILEEYSKSNETTYQEWTQHVHFPRTLAGIGDVLSFLERHADAADAYTRALEYRETNLEQYSSGKQQETMKLEELVDRRKVVEGNVLVAEELLACPEGKDVVTTETESCLVKASERTEYARGYYNKARDQLQEAVLLMGKLAARNGDSKEFLDEKEDVCYASVMVMAVGNQLAALDEQKEQEETAEPTKKKAKR
jgi:tetratricopeptide (TPR) repeat protein